MATVILFILIFGAVVTAHEFGHFLLAKANGIHVVEFFIGMGPSLFSFQKGGTKYSLKLFPIGGACMFEGEDGLQVKEGEESEGSFLKANVWARISTVLAGPVFNFILAYLVALIVVNMGVLIREPVASDVIEGGAAVEAGMQAGDRFVSIDGDKIYLYEELLLFTQTYSGGEVEIAYERDGEIHTVSLSPKYDESTGRYMLGIINSDYKTVNGVESLKYAWYELRYSVVNVYKSLGMLVTGRIGRQDVAGPLGMAAAVGEVYEGTKEYGWQTVLVNMLNIVVLLSANLGIINLLPLPALDGGRLVFLLLEVLRGKPVSPEKEGMVHFVGLMFFMVLMVLIFFNDLVNIFVK